MEIEKKKRHKHTGRFINDFINQYKNWSMVFEANGFEYEEISSKEDHEWADYVECVRAGYIPYKLTAQGIRTLYYDYREDFWYEIRDKG